MMCRLEPLLAACVRSWLVRDWCEGAVAPAGHW